MYSKEKRQPRQPSAGEERPIGARGEQTRSLPQMCFLMSEHWLWVTLLGPVPGRAQEALVTVAAFRVPSNTWHTFGTQDVGHPRVLVLVRPKVTAIDMAHF